MNNAASKTICWKKAVCCLLIAVAAAIAYFPVFHNGFAWDDDYLVLKNPGITDISNIPGFFTGTWAKDVEFKLGQEHNRPYFRPMALTSMAIDWAIAGPDRLVFHISNLLVHVLAAWFLFLWLFKVFDRRANPDQPESRGPLMAAFIGALLWAVHPVSTEAVNIVSYRTTLISGLTTFGAMWLLTPPHAGPDGRTPRTGWAAIAIATLMFAAGMLAKETTLVLPGLLFVMDLSARRLDLKRFAAVYIPLGLVGIGWLVLRQQFIGAGYYTWFEGLTAGQAVLMFGRIFYLYVRLVFMPWPLCPFYDWGILGVPRSITEPDIAAGFLLFTLVLGATVLLWRRRPMLSGGLAFFLLALLPVSHIVPFFDAAGERFMYVPLAGVMLAAGAAMIEKPVAPRWQRIAKVAAVVVLGAFMTLTAVRSTQWKSGESILRVTTRDFPSSVSAHLGLARVLMEKKRPAEAIEPLKQVIELAPDIAIGHALLAVARARSGDIAGARLTLRMSPLPDARQPSAVELTRSELLKANEVELAKRIGLMGP